MIRQEISGHDSHDDCTRLLIREALQEANAPERRALKDYPLTERERKSIRGCAKTP